MAPGGGGSGGVIDLHATTLNFGGANLLQAIGGPGGGLSSVPTTDPNFSSEADGGLGFIRLDGTIVNTPTVDGVNISGVVPLPGAVWLFGSGLIGLIVISRRDKKAASG